MENTELQVGDYVIFSSPDYSDLRCGTGVIHELLGGSRASVRWDIEGDPMPSICSLDSISKWNK